MVNQVAEKMNEKDPNDVCECNELVESGRR